MNLPDYERFEADFEPSVWQLAGSRGDAAFVE
jgi:hypothetical protein